MIIKFQSHILFSKNLLVDSKKKVALSESIWPKPGIIKNIHGIDNVKKFKGFEFIFFRYKVGDTITEYVDCTKRVCFIIASGKSYEKARQNINKIKDNIKIEIE